MDIAKEITNEARARVDPVFYTEHRLGRKLYSNQIDIVKEIVDWSCKKLLVLQARQGGKTEALACGLVQAAEKNISGREDGTKIIVFANKEEQVNIDRDRCWALVNGNREKFENILDYKQSVKSRLVFKNGSVIRFETANPLAHMEGLTADVIVLEESQRMDDFVVSNIILPMGGARDAKIIQIGTPRSKNHFYRAFKSQEYKKVVHDWTQCPNLWQSGAVEIDGRKYSRFVLDQAPRRIWMELFPHHPELWKDGDMDEADFRTQYMLDWILDVSTALSESEQKKLIDGSMHSLLESGTMGERYYAGIDYAQGGGSAESDATAVCIWRVSRSGVLEKVYAHEMRGLDLPTQTEEINYLVNPRFGVFRCVQVCADYTVCGVGEVDRLRLEGVPVVGVNFTRIDPVAQKNYKNSMFDKFRSLLNRDRIKYPKDTEKDPIMMMHYLQWCSLEVHKGQGVNRKLHAPPGEHDDGVMADLLAVWAIGGASSVRSTLSNIPHAVVTPPMRSRVQTLAGRGMTTTRRLY